MSATSDQIIRLYDTVFDRAPDLGGLEFWQAAAARGVELDDMAGFFMTAPEFAATYGQPDSGSFVRSMYENVLDRPGETEGVQFWTRALDAGFANRSQIVVYFSESQEHIQQMARPQPEPLPPLLPDDFPRPVDPPAPAPQPPQQPQPQPPGGNQSTETTSGTGSDRKVPYFGTEAGDRFEGSPSREAVLGYGGDDTIRGGDGGDQLFGGSGNDWIEGNDGDDYITGDDGDDSLNGNRGSDTIVGGAGADTMGSSEQAGGEAGRDVFLWNAAADMDGDRISSFENNLDALDFRPLGLAFRGTGAFEATGQAQLRYEVDASLETIAQNRGSAISSVFIDANGDGAADARMLVYGSVVTDANFLV